MTVEVAVEKGVDMRMRMRIRVRMRMRLDGGVLWWCSNRVAW